jgi:hypothetical protein
MTYHELQPETGANGSESQDTIDGAYVWERRRLAGVPRWPFLLTSDSHFRLHPPETCTPYGIIIHMYFFDNQKHHLPHLHLEREEILNTIHCCIKHGRLEFYDRTIGVEIKMKTFIRTLCCLLETRKILDTHYPLMKHGCPSLGSISTQSSLRDSSACFR